MLALGFALTDSPPGRALGDLVAQALAVPAGPLLHLLGIETVRSGAELRTLSNGWAIRISEVCDGLGLLVSFVALLVAGRPGWKRGLRQALIGLAAIQVFNLLRILVLALVLEHAPDVFDRLHLEVFPYVTVLLIAALVMPGRGLLRLVAVALPLVLVWHWLAGPVSALLVPPANLLLTLLAPPEVTAITGNAGGWSTGSLFLASEDPVSLFRAPIWPADFTFALPVLAAAALLTGRLGALAVAPVLMVVALALAAISAVWGLASEPMILLQQDGSGAFTPLPYERSETALALVRLAQNTLVHFLLLVLPFLGLQRRRHG